VSPERKKPGLKGFMLLGDFVSIVRLFTFNFYQKANADNTTMPLILYQPPYLMRSSCVEEKTAAWALNLTLQSSFRVELTVGSLSVPNSNDLKLLFYGPHARDSCKVSVIAATAAADDDDGFEFDDDDDDDDDDDEDDDDDDIDDDDDDDGGDCDNGDADGEADISQVWDAVIHRVAQV
jgi:hypothetical protein